MKAIFWGHFDIIADVVVAIIIIIIIFLLKLSAHPLYWLGCSCLLGKKQFALAHDLGLD